MIVDKCIGIIPFTTLFTFLLWLINSKICGRIIISFYSSCTITVRAFELTRWLSIVVGIVIHTMVVIVIEATIGIVIASTISTSRRRVSISGHWINKSIRTICR